MISGATGFVGSALGASLAAGGCDVVGLSRGKLDVNGPLRFVHVDADESAADSIEDELKGTQVFIHLAARTHASDLRDSAALELYRRANVELTVRFARACAQAGVRRFVFLSSVKACGERSYDKPFSEADAEAPEDYYGKTKLEAEERVLDFAAATNMDVVIIRPPLVYGPGVKGNFLRLLGWVRRGVPLPFAAVDNRRSLIGLRNLVDVLERAAAAPNGFRGKFFVSDAADTSTPALISQIAASMHRPSRLVRVSPVLLEWGARLMGEREMAYRLLGNLQVDASLIRSRLGWHPAVSMTEELRATAAWYLRRNSP